MNTQSNTSKTAIIHHISILPPEVISLSLEPTSKTRGHQPPKCMLLALSPHTLQVLSVLTEGGEAVFLVEEVVGVVVVTVVLWSAEK